MNKLISRVLSVGLSTVAVTAMLTSCSENELVETKTVSPKEQGLVTITATSGSDTRVQYTSGTEYKGLTWGYNDKIQIYGDDMAGETYNIVNPSDWVYGETNDFTGNPVDGATKAFYPVSRFIGTTEVRIASLNGYNNQTISFIGQSKGDWGFNSLTDYTYMAGDVLGTAEAPTVAFEHLTSQLELKFTMPTDYDSYKEPIKRIELVTLDGTEALHAILHLTDDSQSTMTDSLSVETTPYSFYSDPKTASVYMKVAPESFENVPMELRVYTESNDGLDTPRYYRSQLGKQTWDLTAGRQYTIEAPVAVADEISMDTSTYPETSYELSEDGLTLIKWLGTEPIVDLTQDPILTLVTAVEGHAFEELETLEQVIMDDDITSIGNSTFAYCPKLKSVILPKTIKSTGLFTFYKCESLTSIDLPESVTLIDQGAFNGCKSLEELPAMTNVDSIASSAFQDCTALTQIKIESWTSKVTAISPMAFMGCENVTYVNLNSLSLTKVSNSLFNGCTNLKVVLLPSTITEIGNSAFIRCRSLTTLTIPANTEKIGSGTFADTAIESLYVPATTTEIGAMAFTSVKSIEVDPANPTYCSVDEGGYHGIFTKDKSTLIRQYVDGASYVVPNTVATISSYAFAISENCMTLTIPSSVSTFESSAFIYMNGLTTINYNKASAEGLISEEATLMLADNYANVTLYVPSTAVASFKATEPWAQFNVKGKNF